MQNKNYNYGFNIEDIDLEEKMPTYYADFYIAREYEIHTIARFDRKVSANIAVATDCVELPDIDKAIYFFSHIKYALLDSIVEDDDVIEMSIYEIDDDGSSLVYYRKIMVVDDGSERR